MGAAGKKIVSFNIGDIVIETEYIKPPDRMSWIGVVVYIEKDCFELFSYLGQYEDLLGIYWFQSGTIEDLPASVIEILQKAT